MQIVDKTYSRSMHDLLEDIDATTSPQDLCRSILKSITDATGAKGCALMLFTSDKKALFQCAGHGLSDWFFKKCTVSTDPSILQALEGKPAVIQNVSSDNRVGYRTQVMKEGIASILNIPINFKDSIIGVMQLYMSEVHTFNDHDISFASMSANFGAHALEEAGFFEIVQKDYDTFQKSMRQMNSELDYEWECEPDVMLVEDEGPIIRAGG